MNKLTDRKVEAMSLGIRGFCKTKKARNRIRLAVSAIVLAAIFIASVPLIIWHYTSMQEKPWQGDSTQEQKRPVNLPVRLGRLQHTRFRRKLFVRSRNGNSMIIKKIC